MNKNNATHNRLTFALFISVLFVAGCSGSGDPQSPTDKEQNSTRVSFDITVPAYVSNALQVKLAWAEKDITAKWNSDELWTVSDDFPANSDSLLVVTFYDDNGAITLASFEQNFETGTNASESVQITADQFNTDRWDSDSDGVNNIDELIAGTNPLGDDSMGPVQASLELVADKTFRISWQPSTGARFYRVLENADGVSGFTQIGEDLDQSTQVLDHRVALYKKVSARYIVQACNAGGCVDSEELIVVGALESAIGYFKASNTDDSGIGGEWAKTVGDSFGYAISLSADGRTLAVGAPVEDSIATGINGNQDDNSALNSGAVYVFARINGAWQQQAYLKASNTGVEDWFGITVSLTADGNTLAVGAVREGAVYVFARVNEKWQQQAYVVAAGVFGQRDWFGRAVSLSADGDTLAVGAIAEDSAATGVNGDQYDDTVANSGAVYVFAHSNGIWQQQAYVKGSHTNQSDHFGSSVSLSEDGNTLAIGAPDEDSRQHGQAYVFARNNGNWQQQACFIASLNVPCSNTRSVFEYGGNQFGVAVSLSADGNTLAVGASYEGNAATGINSTADYVSAFNAGAVFVFGRSNGDWQRQAYVKASNTGSHDNFGASVSLSADGSMLAVGAPAEASAETGLNANQDNDYNFDTKPGAVYTFVHSNGSWQQQAYLKSSNTDKADYTGVFDELDWSTSLGDEFGYAVSLSAYGDALAVGAPEEQSAATGINGRQDDNSAPGAGAVYLY